MLISRRLLRHKSNSFILLHRELRVHRSNLLLQLLVLLHEVLEILVEQIQIGLACIVIFSAIVNTCCIPVLSKCFVKYLSILFLLERAARIAIASTL